MSAAEVTIAICLVVLGVAHSALGESEILKPLFAEQWSIGTPRWAADRILRFAWHLTSIAWIALGAIVLGGDVLPIVGTMSLISAIAIFVMLRGHLAWPLFLIAGLASFYADGALGATMLEVSSALTAGVLVAAAGLHIYWAVGGKWVLDRSLPTSTTTGFSPGPRLTLSVAIALLAFAGLVASAAFGVGPTIARWLVIAGIGVLTIRAIGDTKVAGFTKTIRGTPFATANDRWFTPLVVFLALGATAPLLT